MYCPFMEEAQSVSGWSKSTIDYISNNKSKVVKIIRGIAKGRSRKILQTADIEDIYSEILMYLYKCDDYNISKAIERSNNGTVVSFEGYINSCIKFCVIRYLTNSYNISKEHVKGYVNEDGKELSIFNIVSDDRSMSEFDSILYDLRQQCKLCEHIRYRYGPDMYLMWYIRLLTLVNGKNEIYKDVLNILGISKKELTKIEKRSKEDEVMINLARAINKAGIAESINILEEYVHSAPKIKEVVSRLC